MQNEPNHNKLDECNSVEGLHAYVARFMAAREHLFNQQTPLKIKYLIREASVGWDWLRANTAACRDVRAKKCRRVLLCMEAVVNFAMEPQKAPVVLSAGERECAAKRKIFVDRFFKKSARMLRGHKYGLIKLSVSEQAAIGHAVTGWAELEKIGQVRDLTECEILPVIHLMEEAIKIYNVHFIEN